MNILLSEEKVNLNKNATPAPHILTYSSNESVFQPLVWKNNVCRPKMDKPFIFVSSQGMDSAYWKTTVHW